MAAFLRKIVQKRSDRSSSASPTKFVVPTTTQGRAADDEFDHWPSAVPMAAAFPRHGPPMRRTLSSNNYCEPNDCLSPLLTPQPQRRYHHHSRTNLARTNSKLAQNGAAGGLGSTEYMTGTWNTRETSTNPYNEIAAEWMPRHRSMSPRKTREEMREPPPTDELPPHQFRSNRRKQKDTYDYLNPQCRIEGCSAAIIVEEARFLVCKHQLAHASNFFRTLFVDHRAFPVSGVEQLSINEYTVVVSGLRYPPAAVQFRWFLESAVPTPVLKDITEETLETCMRLSRRFQAKGLEVRCQKYICENVETRPPVMALCWLNWVLKHRFDKRCVEACLPTVARLSLAELERHRQMMTEKLMADLLAMKLRACYVQTAVAFQTIHKMDHFQVDVEKCPRCNRQREQGRVRIYANPCQKLLGCERCLVDHEQCELGRRVRGTDFQAFYQCDHGLWPFNDRTEDCHCQLGVYKTQMNIARVKLATPCNGNSEDSRMANGRSPSPTKSKSHATSASAESS